MIPLLFSVSYAGLWGQHTLDLPAFLRKAAALGYPAVELMGKRPHLSLLDCGGDELARLRDIADECRLDIATIAAYNDFTVNQPGVPFPEIQIAYIRGLIVAARQLGAKQVRLFTGATTDPQAMQSDWTTCVQAVRECARIGAGEGVVIGVQNHHDIGISTASYVEFLHDVDHPNCRAMFDPWSPALLGEDLRHWARVLAPRMVQTTFADYIRLPRYTYLNGLINYQSLPDAYRAVPLGSGFIDYPAFVAGLREGGFDGYVAYEMCSPLRGGGSEANLDQTAQDGLAYIHSLFSHVTPAETNEVTV